MATILVVEDNEPSRDALARRLERRGYQRAAGRRRPAGRVGGARRAARSDPDGSGLPGIDGWEATRQLEGRRGDPAHSDHRAERARDDQRSRAWRSPPAATTSTPSRFASSSCSRRSNAPDEGRSRPMNAPRARCSSSTTTSQPRRRCRAACGSKGYRRRRVAPPSGAEALALVGTRSISISCCSTSRCRA